MSRPTSAARPTRIRRIARLVVYAWLAGALPAAGQKIHFPTKGGLIRTDQPDTAQLIRLYNRMIARNLDSPEALPSATIDSIMSELSGRPVGDRIGAWANEFWKAGRAEYLFGLDSLGYATRGLLVDDAHTDCVLFFYRTSELGRSSTALEAVQFAFGTRFYGAPIAEVVRPDGTLDYDHPAHLDYTIDMIRSGIWGEDVSDSVGPTVADPVGTSRYPPDSVRFVPRDSVNPGAIRSGDGIHLVLDEASERGRRIREASGALIGHIGVAYRDGEELWLIHPASADLPGIYEGGRVVRVPLVTYLRRVDTFKGIIVTRVRMF